MVQTTLTNGSHPSPPSSIHSGTKRKRPLPSESKHYAVQIGKRPGVYDTWEECLSQVKGFRGAVFKSFSSRSDAVAFAGGSSVSGGPSPTAKTRSTSTTKKQDDEGKEQKFYAVQNGKIPGVYTDWAAVLKQITGVRNARHKKFSTRVEAEAFVKEGRKNLGVNGFGGSSKRDSAVDTLNGGLEEENARKMIRTSAPGLQMTGQYEQRADKEGNVYELGRGPLPSGAEDGFDPNLKLSADGKIVGKSEDERLKTKFIPVEADPLGMLKIYTDGSSLRNGQAGARAGVGVFFGPADPKNVSEALKGTKQTNQRAELTAILRALDIAPLHRDVTIYTDSKYSIECVTNWYKAWLANGWVNSKGKPVENRDLVSDIREKINERDDLRKKTYFVWIKGHADDAGNIAADRLAVEGASKGLGAPSTNGTTDKTEDGDDADGDEVMDGDDDEPDDVKQAFADMAEALK